MSDERKRGRPRLWNSAFNVRVTSVIHDDVCVEAVTRGVDVSQVIRERLASQPFRNSKIAPPVKPS